MVRPTRLLRGRRRTDCSTDCRTDFRTDCNTDFRTDFRTDCSAGGGELLQHLLQPGQWRLEGLLLESDILRVHQPRSNCLLP